MGPLIEAAIPALTAWVTTGATPPASTTGQPGDGSLIHQVQLPSVACPTGTRYPWPGPGGAASETGFAPYDGRSLEPVDSRGSLVDIDADGLPAADGDGVRDAMPSMSQVWRTRGLLGAHEAFTGAVYLRCVRGSVTSLERQGLITPAAGAAYVAQAIRDAR
jgi:hypothetical protein